MNHEGSLERRCFSQTHARQAGTLLAIFHIISSRLSLSPRVLAKAAQHNPLAVRTMVERVPGRLPPCHQFGTLLTAQPQAYPGSAALPVVMVLMVFAASMFGV